MKLENFLNKLSPVKRQAATYLSQGLSPEKVAKRISKENGSGVSNAMAWVTMAIDLAKKNKVELLAKEEKQHKPTYSHDPEKDVRKVKIQKRLLEEILASNISSGIVLTLSWIKCIVETQINAKFPNLQFLSCELDKPTFFQLENEILSKGLKFMLEPLRCEIGRIIRLSAKDTYSHLLLDYCGHLNSFKDEIEIAIKNKIVKQNGIIWITVVGRSGKGLKGFNAKDELISLIKKSGLDDYKVEFIANYRDTDKAPMTTAIIRRLK